MSARLCAHPIAPDDPARATHEIATTLLEDAPRRRPLRLVVARWGAHPGLRPSPWALDGIARAVSALGLRATAVHLDEQGVADPITAQLTAAGIEPAEPGAALALRSVGSRRSLRIPRQWLGDSVCLVLPCMHHHDPDARGTTPSWRGPLGTAMVELLGGWGGTWPREPVDRATRCMAELFGHVSAVIDGSWWAPREGDGEAAPLLLAPERALGLSLPAPLASEAALTPERVDRWLGLQLGLPLPRRSDDAALAVVGPAAETPWPTLPRAHARPGPRARGGLAGQALGALWRRADRPGAGRAALPPAVPGALAALWDAYAPGAASR